MSENYGNYAFGLHDLKLAAWTSAGTFGTSVDAPGAQMMDVTPQFVTGQQIGDDQIVAVASRLIGAEIRIRFASMSLAAMEKIMGVTATSSVSSPNEVKQFKPTIGGKMPYFAASGIASSDDDGGSYNLFVPKAKATAVTIGGTEYGAFKNVEVTAYAVADATYQAFNIIKQETAVTTAVIPPANIA